MTTLEIVRVAVPNPAKLDPRLRALLELDRDELLRIKRDDDRRRRDVFDALKALGNRLRALRDDKDASAKLAARMRALIAELPVPLTFGLYLPGEDAGAAQRVTHIRVPCVSATVRSEASAEDLSALGLHVRNQAGNIFTAYVPLELCPRLSRSSAIDYVEVSRPYVPQLINAIPKGRIDHVHASGVSGTGVIVGIIDSGLDFYHEHFRNSDGSSRVLYLWDQTLIPEPGESGPAALAGFNPSGGTVYGVDYSQAQIDSELSGGLPAYRIVRSNPGTGHTDEGSHGTLVASCAAGNGHLDNGKRVHIGAAPGADIIHVRPDESLYSSVFADSTNVLDGFAYIFARASQMQRPCVVNLSLSDNLGGHDGSTNGERFLDNLLLLPGRAITCSAGDGNIFDFHTRGQVVQGETTEVKLVYSEAPLPLATNNDTIQLWYDGQDEFAVTLTVPTPVPTVIGPIPAGTSTPPTSVGGITVSVDSALYPNNNDNLVEVRLTNVSPTHPIPGGDWIVALHGTTVVNGAFDAWVDRTNVLKVGWEHAVSDEGTIGVPATAQRVIAVGGHKSDGGSCENSGNPRPTIMNISGCGPTRDGRTKPEIAGPGEVNGARSRDMNQPPPPGYPITEGSYGTSDSAPIVAGAAALLFECRGNELTSTDIKQLLADSAGKPDTSIPSNAFGFGYLCMEGICAAPVRSVDVWLRDSTTDTGIEPYTGGLGWLSPDITVLDAAGNPTDNPRYDAANLWNNFIDVAVRNRGTQTARNVEVYLYWADPATNLPFPGEWKTGGIYAGQPAFIEPGNKIVVNQLAAGADTTVRFAWAPPAPGSNIRGDDHFCLIARVEHEADPSHLNAGGWPIVQGSNNIALRNLHVQDVSTGDMTTAFFVIGTDDDDALEVTCAKLAGDIELFLPTRALPWRELALLERFQGPRPGYGCRCGTRSPRSSTDPAEEIRRVLQREEVTRILGVTGVETAHISGATTRLVAERGSSHLRLSEVRVNGGAKMPVRVWARRPRLEEGVGWVHVGQRSGGKLTGGASLELRAQPLRIATYDVRRRGNRVEVTPRARRPPLNAV